MLWGRGHVEEFGVDRKSIQRAGKADGSDSDFRWENWHSSTMPPTAARNFSKLLRDLQQRVQERMAATSSGNGAH